MQGLRKIIHHKPIVTAGIAFAVSALFIWIRQLGWLQDLELYGYDRFLQQRPAHGSNNPPIALVKVTEKDIRRFGHPLTDELMAQILEILLSHNPAVIGIDIFRDIPSRGRDHLETILASHPNVVVIEKRLGEPVAPPSILEHSDQVGFADLKQDSDGVIRRALLLLWDSNEDSSAYLSFALNLSLIYLQHHGITMNADPDNEANVMVGQTVIPRFQYNDGGYSIADDGGYQFLLDYDFGARPFPALSISELFANNGHHLKMIEGKVVIIGTAAHSVQDSHETPYSDVTDEPMYGMEIHAHTVDQLIRAGLSGDSPIRVIDENYEIGLIMVFGLTGALLGVLIRSVWLLIAGALSTGAFFVFAPYSILLYGFWIPPAVLSLTWGTSYFWSIVYIGFLERFERRMIMMLFGKFVAQEVAVDLWEHRDEFLRGGRPKPVKLTATVLLTDLKDFTAAVERIDPAKVMAWLNSYIAEMTLIISNHGGIVEDYAGDGIKATFGIPVPRTTKQAIRTDAENAVRCALSMGQKLNSLNERWEHQGLPMERIRIGICTGVITAGSIGSTDRMSYTTVGDTVNTAARLENFSKEAFAAESAGSFRVLADESTWKWLGPDFITGLVGKHHLRGKHKATTIYRVYAANTSEKETQS